jgi:hypothetical protein
MAPAVEVPTEETPAAAVPAGVTPRAEVPAGMETPTGDPWEVVVDATTVASASKGNADTWRPWRPVREGTLAMVQPGIPPAFDRNERMEIEAWEGYDQANYDIERALAFALDIHRGWSLQASDVSDYPATSPFVFLWFFAHVLPLAVPEADVA